MISDLSAVLDVYQHYCTVPVLLLIQMSVSGQTEDEFPTATVNGTCHCKLQRGRAMSVMVSGIGLGFIASVIR